MRTLSLALVLSACVASAADRYVGGGAQSGVTAPLLFLGAGGPKVSVSQILYAQTELGIPAGGTIIDVAWRKADLTPLAMSGCDVEIWMKNVMLGTTFAADSTQTFGDATNMGTKVFSGSMAGLPQTMGFVTLPVTVDAISFDYTGADLEVTTVANCLAASGDAASAPLEFRYDDTPARVRGYIGDVAPTAATVLKAESWLVTRRPHTRFRYLEPIKKLELRVGDFQLTSNATYGTAPKHLSQNKPAPFRIKARNAGKSLLTVNAINFSNSANLTGAPNLVTSAVGPLQPGEEKDIVFEITAATVATARIAVGVASDAAAGAFNVTFQGPVTATPEAQPNLAQLNEDRTSTTLMTTGSVIQLGSVPADSERDVTLLASNYGAADGVALSISVTQQPTGGLTTVPSQSALLNTQTDLAVQTRVRAPSTPGPFTTQVRVTIGSTTYDVTIQGTVEGPELEVSVDSRVLVTPATEPVGDLELGVAYTKSLLVKNVGLRPLTLSRKTVSKTDLDVTYGETRSLLNPQQSTTLTYTLIRTGPNPELRIELLTNDSDESPFSVRWSNSSVAAGPRLLVSRQTGVQLEPGSESAFNLKEGENEIPIQLVNVGDAELVITGITLDGIQNAAPTGEPAPEIRIAASASVVYTINAHTPKRRTDLPYKIGLSFSSNDQSSPYAFSLTGIAHSECSVAGNALLPTSALWFFALLQLRRRRTPRASKSL